VGPAGHRIECALAADACLVGAEVLLTNLVAELLEKVDHAAPDPLFLARLARSGQEGMDLEGVEVRPLNAGVAVQYGRDGEPGGGYFGHLLQCFGREVLPRDLDGGVPFDQLSPRKDEGDSVIPESRAYDARTALRHERTPSGCGLGPS
jgi:hypothetical protein